MNRTLNMYSIFYYNMINIRVLLIIQVLIILKHFRDLERERQFKKEKRKRNGDLCVERERGRQFFKKYMETCMCIYIYIERERERD
jgi:hypothetical protein